jgi:hypothetical protein
MQIELSDSEAETLRAALERQVEELTHELACTERRDLQHELARSLEQLESIVGKLPRPS